MITLLNKKVISGFVIGIAALPPIFWLSQNDHVTAKDDFLATNAFDKEHVAHLIKKQGKEKDYDLEHLTFQIVDLDEDDDLELVASAPGGTHLGNFFIFDKRKDSFLLVAERSWHVSKDNLDRLKNNEALPYETKNHKKLFETIEITGGSGVHLENVHIWYLDNGNFVEAWEGNLKTVNSFQNVYSATIATYHMNADRLFYFSSSYNHSEDDMTSVPIFTQNTTVFRFDGSKFIELSNQHHEVN